MKPVLGITVEPDQVHDLIGQESFGQAWHGFELPGFVLGDRTWDETLSQVQRGISHVRDILPDDVARYLPETDTTARRAILDSLVEQLKLTVDYGVKCCTLELGIERIAVEHREAALLAREDLIKRLLPVADSLDVSICLPQREPCTPPGAHFAEYATQLVTTLDHDACKLTLNVFPNELHTLTVTELVQRSYSHVGVIRFFYEPGIGLRLDREQQLIWARALHLRRYDGLVVFCPLVKDRDKFCFEADQLLGLVQEIWLEQNREFDTVDGT
ncbi:MAG TPA: hypothetical protein DCR55_13055 [Lentisphaeria bacterium]|nr:hypothetical protein [Lentisphaeria bacterium]